MSSRECNRKRSDMSPCVITDGPVCYAINNPLDAKPVCVSCGWSPAAIGVPAPADWDQQVAEYLKKYMSDNDE